MQQGSSAPLVQDRRFRVVVAAGTVVGEACGRSRKILPVPALILIRPSGRIRILPKSTM